jgi:crotonobetainyl-CoA:carnitine CoA-transferase CaiB-like acyl-CoA transferase
MSRDQIAHASALAGVRVIDFGQYMAGPMLAMLLADFGAEVVRIDPPGGPRWNHPANAILNRGKRSVVLDLKRAGDVEIARDLIASADVVIENFRPGTMAHLGLDPREITERLEELIWCSLPGFGSDDPRAGLRGWEGVICAAAGLYNPGMFNSVGDPVFSALPLASYFGAVVASHGVAAALFDRERTGLGQRIEIPLFDACFEAIGCYADDPFALDVAGHQAIIAEKVHPAMALSQRYRGSDGRLVLMTPPFDSLVKLQEKLLPPELLSKRDDASVQLAVELLTAKFAERTGAEWERFLQEEFDVPAAVVQSTGDWLEDDEHALASGCVIEINDPVLGRTRQAGFGVTLDRTPPRVAFPRQLLDKDGETLRSDRQRANSTLVRSQSSDKHSGALEGIKVIDLAMLLAGPTAARVLAQYGADVVKISNPRVLRADMDPLSDDGMALIGHITANEGKRTTFIDLKKPEGLAIVRDLIKTVDVVHENFTPGVVERLKVGEADCREINPGLIYSSLNLHAFGGYRQGYRGHEELGQMITGIAARLGGKAGAERSPILVNDHATGHLCAFGIILALYHRERTGVGQHVRTSLSQNGTMAQLPFMISYAGAEWNEPKGLDANGWNPLNRLYAGREGHFYLAAIEPDALGRLATANGLEGVDKLTGSNLEAELELRFATLPAVTWAARIEAVGVSAHPYRPIHELMADRQVQQRGLSVLNEHRELGLRRKIGIPGRFSRTQPRIEHHVVRPGLDTVDVVTELGWGDRVDQLLEDGVISLG